MRAALDELLATASEDEHVVAVLRFGRSLDDPHRARDVDVAVVVDRGAEVALDDELTYHRFSSGEPNAGLDVSVFRQLPVHVRQRVLAEAEPVCVDDIDDLYAIAIAAVNEYERLRPFHRR